MADRMPSTRRPWSVIPFSPDFTPIFDPQPVVKRPTGRGGAVAQKHDRYENNRRGPISGSCPPETEAQALMEARPGHEPRKSIEEGHELHERIKGHIEDLPPEQRWVFDAHTERSMSLAEIGEELGISKSSAHRIFTKAREALQANLEDVISETSSTAIHSQ